MSFQMSNTTNVWREFVSGNIYKSYQIHELFVCTIFRLLFSFFNFSLFDINNPQNLNLNLNFFILRIYAVHQTMVLVKKPEFTYEFTK